jgi:pyrroline-5-carboxylate reductase
LTAFNLNQAQVTFIGGGNMASAMIGGLLKQGLSPNRLQVVEPSPAQNEWLKTHFNLDQVWNDHQSIFAPPSTPLHLLVLAVKPQMMQAVCLALSEANWVKDSLILSIAAGTRIDKMRAWLSDKNEAHARALAIIRTMPNTPALVAQGITGAVASVQVSPAQKQLAQAALQAIGQSVWFDDETSLDAVTAVSGSGPAYVFKFLEALQAGGERVGLSAQDARQLALQTVVGAAQLANDSPESFATLRERVTSKGGTTAAALQVLSDRGFDQLISDAVKAACDRSLELGR